MLTIKSFVTLLLVGSMLLIAPVGCKTSGNTDSVVPVLPRTLVSSTLIGEYSTDQLRSRFTGANAALQFFIRYGIKAYRLDYTTTNTDGKPIKASGALIIPTVPTAIPLLSMQHGTITSENDAPSNFGTSSEAYSFGSVFASQGYIIAAPDYIGYGASKDLPHTYEQRNGLATASLDMLRATRDFLADQAINWDKRLFIAGYSEGGYATMSLQKKLEEETTNEFNLVASSCGAGAYDKPAFMKQIINDKSAGVDYINRLYVWVLQTYDRIYGLNRPMSTYFKEPYATQITNQGINASINVSLNQTFTDAFKQGINDGTDKAFLAAVQDNDIHDWKPRTPTRLYHGDADEIVSFLNSQNAYDAMKKRGATNVELIPIKGATHGTGIVTFILGTYDFFGSIQ
ncbi:prolyl oligopeptidase family serine peptidase [Spirosoma sp. KCTC 42546]|uniref:alpha/beta hydrolase family protein n=1 Tax=Spirosoma sp. KCTC 42546 TaxID=2520506 RepID=UPI00115A4510|nr:lipase family protein [Spirosoma sp. KCTC 42546]QDK81184.1 prolyl oligopeptidase family serine peptidase [Spirosoma sp. KCTC 42546]